MVCNAMSYIVPIQSTPDLILTANLYRSSPREGTVCCLHLLSLAFIMALTVLALSFTLVFLQSLAAPVDTPGNMSSVDIVVVTDVVTSPVDVLDTATSVVVVEPLPSVTSLLLSPVFPSSRIVSAVPVDTAALVSISVALPLVLPLTTTDVLTNTVTTTLTESPATVTVSAPPLTVTDVITIVPPLPTPTAVQTAWAAPPQMTDLSAFNVTNFACGQQNLRIINDVPPNANTSILAAFAEETEDLGALIPSQAAANSSAVLQLFYPADSINPASEPQGGADFYATPLDMKDAQNVSLEYSVFFPEDFDWVQGGKLPGIYGGHTGCSGGDAAVTCFSTRLMWRAGGAGELYLYAPKDKQTEALCSTPPLSVCDAAYGLSIGRGSFNFTPGAWTHVRQTVSLNTPGAQDGQFILEVNGKQVINRTDVFYRNIPAPEDSDDGDGDDDDDDDDDDDSGGLLGDLLGNLLIRAAFWPASGVLAIRDNVDDSSPALLPPPTAFAERPATDAAASALLAGMMATSQTRTPVQETLFVTSTSTVQAAPLTQTLTSTATSTATVFAPSPTDLSLIIEQAQTPQPVGFTGLFFSTFFGGHEPEYATPKDQYTWFKNFAMTINN
ncbi:hypothetical protein AcV5_005597 [Taiwanofungus camphoratus]|nr:hypothetical protein AcV5_005597 [Antrodia cinnamomea]